MNIDIRLTMIPAKFDKKYPVYVWLLLMDQSEKEFVVGKLTMKSKLVKRRHK